MVGKRVLQHLLQKENCQGKRRDRSTEVQGEHINSRMLPINGNVLA